VFGEVALRIRATLASYKRPPITEVVVAVAFAPLPGWTSATPGRIWEHLFRGDFPTLEDQPPYDPPVERFGIAGGPGLSISLTETPPVRLWMRSEDGSQLLQLQPDWFAANWIRVKPEMQYGRWPERRAAFEQAFSRLDEFLQADAGTPLEPAQVEVTYINHIESGESWASHGELHRVLATVAPSPIDDSSVQLESRTERLTYRLLEDGEPVGRLHVTCEPVINRESGRHAYRMNLTGRGRPLDAGLEGVLSFADLARSAIVQTFDAITTSEMHAEWGRDNT
jgi:uncharacterized protein (TIGR04255 family)